MVDALTFTHVVVGLSLRAFLCADPNAAVNVEETLLAHIARSGGIATKKDAAGSERDNGAGG